MNHLIEKNLLSIDSESKLTTTARGIEFLEHYHTLEDMLDLTIQKQSIKNDVYSQYLLSH